MTGLRRPSAGVVLATVLVAGSAGVVAMAGVPALRADRALRVLSPQDGNRVDAGFLLAWTGTAQSYAVVVDRSLPAPGEKVAAGPNVLTVTGTSLRLTLGPRSGGSPSARRHHTVVVVPLDASGRRAGEATAAVRVRT